MRQITYISHVCVTIENSLFESRRFLSDSAILGMINVNELHGKSAILYLCSHQIQDLLTAQWHGSWQVQVA
jgi:hypothetical protein